jgi:choline dehydrogenase-like flavoprotein
MGKVVDNSLRVNGVEGLRVIDASVIPMPLASHLQACVYALGEQAADIIVQASGQSGGTKRTKMVQIDKNLSLLLVMTIP